MRKGLNRSYLTTSDFARARRCSRQRVLQWVKERKIPTEWLSVSRLAPGQHHRFKDTPEVREFLETGKLPALTRRGRPPGKPGLISLPIEIQIEYVPPTKEQVAKLTPAQKEKLKGHFLRDVAHFESANRPMKWLKRVGKKCE